MNYNMLRSRNNLKVFQSVVSLGAINVMNNLFRSQVATNRRLNNESMLSDVTRLASEWMSRVVDQDMTTTRKTNSTLPVRMVYSSGPLAKTLIGTKNISRLLMAFVVPKTCSALGALKNSFPRFVVAFPTAKPGPIRRWRFESTFTYLTSVIHIGIIQYAVRGGVSK